MAGSRRPLLGVILAAVLALSAPALLRAESATINAGVEVSPLGIDLAISTAQAAVGQRVHVAGSIANLGASREANIVVELRVANDGLRIQSATVQNIVRLQPGQQASVAWAICGQTPGNYVLMARATLAGASIDSPARLLPIVPGKVRGCR
jgi:hypothetical protein